MSMTRFMLIAVLGSGCQPWQMRLQSDLKGPWDLEPACDTQTESCCEDLRHRWATDAESVFGDGAEADAGFLDGFPGDVDFEHRAVLVLFLAECPDTGYRLRPRRLGRSADGVHGVLDARMDGRLHAFSRPAVFVETPAEWANEPVDIEYLGVRFPLIDL